MFTKIFWITILAVLNTVVLSYGERIKNKMYIPIQGSAGCYRRMNGTHQIGCSSKGGGSNGVIHYCDKESDLDFIIKNGMAGPYVPVMADKMLSTSLIDKLKTNKDLISGLVIHKVANQTPEYFTHDDQCPNERFGVDGTCSRDTTIWNPRGTGLLFTDIPFPFFYIDSDEDIMHIKNCFQKFNNFSFEEQDSRSLCSLQLNAFMNAATSTPTCRRRSNKITHINPIKLCDPLGDYNIWASLYPVVNGTRKDSKPITDVKYIVVAAHMDTTSLFERTSGAQSPVTSMVSLLGVAKYLKTILPNNTDPGKNILFIFFNGETYDYLGSQRMLYDMVNGDFPVKDAKSQDIIPIIKPENISLFIEINQIKKTSSLFVHYLKDSTEVTNILNQLNVNKGTTVNITPVKNSLPPASLHTFLKDFKDMAGIVITDHMKEYSNPYYNSIYDNASNINYKYYNMSSISEGKSIPDDSLQKYIANVATVIAKSIYQEISGNKYSGAEELDVGLIDELLHCYLENPNCRVHTAINVTKLQNTPFSLYVGIDHPSNFLTPHVALTLGWLTGDHEGDGNINCTNKPRNYAYKYFNMSKSIYDLDTSWCYKITFNQTEAVSPAFMIEDYDWASGKYSSWSESTWSEISMRIFLKPSPMHEKVTITIGSLSMCLSFIIVYFFKSKSHILFMPTVASDPPTEC